MINDALRVIRVYHGISQTELAYKLKISKSYLSEIENGKKNVSLELLSLYSNQFDIPVSSLMLFSENINNDVTLAGKVKFSAAKKIIKLMEWLSVKDES